MTTDVILAKLNELQEDNILAKEIFEKINNKELVTRIIKSITIPKPLQFKLSILNINMEKTVHHCLLVALTSIYIAHKLNLETDKIVKLACAAIFLDIGLLHLAQEIFNKTSSLSNEERNQIYSHPIIAALIMNSYIHDKSVSLAILDHHERADGSGYPKGKLLDDISKHGQILGIAELAVSISESSGKYNFKARIQAILKFNSDQYIKEALPILLNLISSIDEPHKIVTVDRSSFMDTLLKLWSTINNFTDDSSDNNIISKYIDNQLFNLKYNLNMSGLSMDIFTMSNDDIDEIINESEEVHAIVDEAYYKLKSIIQEIKRRWLDSITTDESFSKVSDWLNQVDTIIEK